MASRRAWLAAGVGVVALAGFGYVERDRLIAFAVAEAAPGPAPAEPVAPAKVAQPVRATLVALRPAALAATYTGTVRPRYAGPLGFRLDGKVAARMVDVGDRVVPGQVIATLDDADSRLDLASTMAEEGAAATDLARAEAEVRRSADLFARGHVARAALDRAESDVAQARSRLDRAGRAREQAENRLDYSVLRAEHAGVVTARLVEAGQVVAAGTPVVHIARTDTLEAEIAMPEQRRATLDGVTASATLWGDEGRTYPLTLREVSPDVDPAARTYRVRLAFDAADDRVALGRTLTVTLAQGDAAPVIALPPAAVTNDGGGPMVWRLPPEGDRVERIAVTVVSLSDGVALVRGPLADGDRVVGLGAQKIDPARPVRIVETAPPPEL